MPFDKQTPYIRSKKQNKGKEKKYTIVVSNIPEGFVNSLIHWDDIWNGKYVADYYTLDEVKKVIQSLPVNCNVKVYKCSANLMANDDDIDSNLEISV